MTETRLDSWKKIAAYLNRDVRTVHRWEQNEGLPVHRHRHGKRGTVYAYQTEIDSWLAQRSDSVNVRNGTATRSRQPWLGALGGAALVCILLAAAFWLTRPDAPQSGDVPGVLIPQSDNRTGESRFDGTVDSYLRGELHDANVSVISPNQLSTTLELMREPAETTVDMTIAQELALRIPDADLIVASTLERFGTSYILSVELIDAVQGSVVGSLRSEAGNEDEIIASLHDISRQTLEAIRKTEKPEHQWHIALDPVTTVSSTAARLYDDATRLMYDGINPLETAVEGLRRAVDLDQEFATAHIQLAFAILESGGVPEDYMPFAERAVDLAENVSEPERLFIMGSYRKLQGDLNAALPSFLAIEKSHPEHFWGQLQLAELSHARGNLDGAAWSMALAADLRPRSVGFQMLAFNFILTTPHTWNAERIRNRLNELNPPSANGGVQPFLPAEFYAFNQLLLEGEAAEALAELNAMRRKLDQLPDDVWTRRSGYAARLAEAYLALGRMADAEELLQSIIDDDADEVRNTPDIRLGEQRHLNALLAVSRSSLCCEELDAAIQTGITFGPISRARLARRDGDTETAIRIFAEALTAENERLRNTGLAPGPAMSTGRQFLLAAALLAESLIQTGQTDSAMRVLERWSDDQSRVAAFMTSPAFAPYWTHLRLRLAQLYADAGMNEHAAGIDDYLKHLLEFADADHFIARQLRTGRTLNGD